MEIKVSKSAIEKVIKRLLPLARSKVLPIIQNFLIEIENNVMKITATQLEIFGTGTLECVSSDKCSFCVDAIKLTAIVNNATGEISLKYDPKKRTLIAEYGHSKHQLGTEDAGDYPSPDEIVNEKTVIIPEITKIVKRSLHAVNKDELRMNMSGVCIKDNNIMATDGFRAIINPIKVGPGTPLMIRTEMSNIIANATEEVELIYTETDIQIVSGDFRYSTKLVDDTFPNVQAVLPVEYLGKFIIDREEFKKALKTVMISADLFNKAVKLTFEDKNILTINASLPDIGSESTDQISYEMETSLPDITFPLPIRFNGDYLVDLLNITESDKLEFNVKTIPAGGSPYVVLNDEYIYLIMPYKGVE